MAENSYTRLKKVLNGEMPDDRLPLIEWASWWDKTVNNWKTQGLPNELDGTGIKQYWNLDIDYQHWFWPMGPGIEAKSHHGHDSYYIENMDDYMKIRPNLYPPEVHFDRDVWSSRNAAQLNGESIVWVTLQGFFWWPRVLFGIEPHLFAFFDHTEAMHKINDDMANYHLRCLDVFCDYCQPVFLTFAEDMSYNHGPMLSKEMFDEFLAPYYRKILPAIIERGITPIIDSDGDVEPLISWFEEIGLKGILPLERMAGVDVNRIRANHPEWIMMGGFDKTVMHLGEDKIRQEFERILPAMKSGRYIPSCDHQTPPAVSMDDYRLFRKLLEEYCIKAVK